ASGATTSNATQRADGLMPWIPFGGRAFLRGCRSLAGRAGRCNGRGLRRGPAASVRLAAPAPAGPTAGGRERRAGPRVCARPEHHGNHPDARAVQGAGPVGRSKLMRTTRIVSSVPLVLAAAGAAAAQQPALRVASPAAAAAVAQRATTAPRIDGRADDAVWRTARA